MKTDAVISGASARLPNVLSWDGFADVVREAAEPAASGHPISLLLLDLDHFKSINDAFGHERGDEVLLEFTTRVRAALPAGALLFRYGGDEFVAWLPGVAGDEAQRVGEAILRCVTAEPVAGEPPLSMSVSIGLASLPRDADRPDDLFAAADRSLYAAKRQGRGRVEQATQEEAAPAPEICGTSRLLERDSELERVKHFLYGLPRGEGGALALMGPAGVGLTSLLGEARQLAGLLGHRVHWVAGRPATRFRDLAALLESFPELYGREIPSVAEWDAVLRAGHEGPVLLLVDNWPDLDAASRELIVEWLASEGAQRSGLICTLSEEERFSLVPYPQPFRGTIAVKPWTRQALATWLRLALRWEPTAEAVDWLLRETRGLPRLATRAVRALEQEEALLPDRSGLAIGEQVVGRSLESLLEIPTPRGNLPGTLPVMVGRAREVREVKRLLAENRLVSVCGPGGMGKTRLGLQVALELQDTFPDGAFWLPMAPIDSPQHLIPALADALDLPLEGGAPPVEQVAQYLRDRRMLLLLDNAEHLVEALAVLCDLLLAAPHLRILVTTREPLGLDEERVLEVSGMAVPESTEDSGFASAPAVQLFERRARHYDPAFRVTPENAAHVLNVCRRLQGIPLAIELAASLLRVLPCEEIAAEVERDLDALSSDRRELPERHRSMRAIFDYSWRLLEPTEQMALRKLSVFNGSFRRERASAVTGVSLPVFTSLVDKSLLRRLEGSRFQLHDVYRQYAKEKLQAFPDERLEVEARLAGATAEWLEGLVPERTPRSQQKILGELVADIQDVRATWNWAVAHRDAPTIARSLDALCWFWDVRGWYEEGITALSRAAAVLETGTPLLGKLLAREALLHRSLGENDRARRLFDEALRLLERHGSTAEVAVCHYGLGDLAYQEGSYTDARAEYQRSHAIYERLGDLSGMALCTNCLGAIALSVGDYVTAREQFSASLELRSHVRDEIGMAKSLGNLGVVHDLLGDPREALRLFRRSLALSRALGDQRNIAASLQNIAVLSRRLAEQDGDAELLREAREGLRESLSIYRRIGARGGVSMVLYNLADLESLVGTAERARELYLAAAQNAVAIGAVPVILGVLVGLAELELRGGDPAVTAELVMGALGNPAMPQDVRERAEQLLAQATKGLPAGAVEELRGRVAEMELEVMVRKTLQSAGIRTQPEIADLIGE